jgi:hypothetical protein
VLRGGYGDKNKDSGDDEDYGDDYGNESDN